METTLKVIKVELDEKQIAVALEEAARERGFMGQPITGVLLKAEEDKYRGRTFYFEKVEKP